MQFEGIGTADMNVDYKNSAITTASGDLFQYIGDGTGGGDLDLTGNTFTNNEPSISTGGGGLRSSRAPRAPRRWTSSTTRCGTPSRNALTIIKSRDNAAGTNNLVANIDNNDIGVAGTANSGSVEGDGMEITTFGDGNATFNVTNNTIRQYNSSGIQFVAGSGVVDTGQFNLNISGNSDRATRAPTRSITLLQGIRVDSGVDRRRHVRHLRRLRRRTRSPVPATPRTRTSGWSPARARPSGSPATPAAPPTAPPSRHTPRADRRRRRRAPPWPTRRRRSPGRAPPVP